jgi:hypothetical protein
VESHQPPGPDAGAIYSSPVVESHCPIEAREARSTGVPWVGDLVLADPPLRELIRGVKDAGSDLSNRRGGEAQVMAIHSDQTAISAGGCTGFGWGVKNRDQSSCLGWQ